MTSASAGGPFTCDGDRRAQLQAEIDAGALHLYGLDHDHAEWILDSFTVLRKYEERDHQDFRTKRLVMAAYDSIGAAIREGGTFVSPLVPTPGSWRRGETATPSTTDRSTSAAGPSGE